MKKFILLLFLLSASVFAEPFLLEEGHYDTINDIDKYPFGNIAITVGNDESIIIWDFSQDRMVNMIELGEGLLSAVAISPGGNYFVAGNNRGQIFVYDFNTQNLISSDKIHKNKITDIVFSGQENVFFTSSIDGNIVQYDISQKNMVKGISFPSQVICLSISPDRNTIAAGTENGNIFILSADNLSSFSTISNAHKDWVTGISFSPDNTKIASVGWDFNINIFEVSSKTKIKTIPVNTDKALNTVDWSSDNNLLAVGCSDYNIYLYRAANYEFAGALRKGHTGKVTAVKFFPDSENLVSIAADAKVNYWELGSQTLKKTYTGY